VDGTNLSAPERGKTRPYLNLEELRPARNEYEFPNPKFQTTNNIQIPIIKKTFAIVFSLFGSLDN
jgi:hypothetical protein